MEILKIYVFLALTDLEIQPILQLSFKTINFKSQVKKCLFTSAFEKEGHEIGGVVVGLID